jgi:hypothetical protein
MLLVVPFINTDSTTGCMTRKLFVVYLTTPSVIRTVFEWLWMFVMVNSELIRMWKDAVVTQLWSTILKGRESHKNTCVTVVEVWTGRRLLPRLSIFCILPAIFPSLTHFRRKLLRKMWQIQITFLVVLCSIFLSSLILCNASSFFTRSVQL